MVDKAFGIDEKYRLSDEDWQRVQPLLPKPKRKKGGRPPMDDRRAMTAIL
jgi:transposase